MNKIFFAVLFFLLIFGSFNFSKAQENTELNFFYSKTCPHCAKEEEFLKELENKYPEVKINQYEIVSNEENRDLLVDFYKKYEVPEQSWGSVPITFTAEKYFVGFNEQVAVQLESCLKECVGGGEGGSGGLEKIKIPIVGTVDLTNLSLPIVTVVVAALDGFNPCAMWILLLLVALLINTRSRKRMWLIAGSFLMASGVIYFLILTAWLNFFLFISYVNITRILIGILALGVGIWQIRNFINYRPGVCKVSENKGIGEKIKEKMTKYAETLAGAPLNFSIILGIIVLALGVNLVEFFCSAGLPAIYTKILALNDVSLLSYYLYLLLYTIVFMVDDLLIFFVAIVTLSRFKVNEKYNYWATLIGGIIILILGLLLILKPELLMFV